MELLKKVSDYIVHETNAMENGAWWDYDEPKTKSITAVKRYIKSIFNLDFYSGGLKNIPKEIELYRVIFAENINSIDKNNLGIHWVRNEKILIEEIIPNMAQYNMSDIKNAWIIRAKCKKEDVDIYGTIFNNVSVDWEQEVTLNNYFQPINFNIKKYNFINL